MTGTRQRWAVRLAVLEAAAVLVAPIVLMIHDNVWADDHMRFCHGGGVC